MYNARLLNILENQIATSSVSFDIMRDFYENRLTLKSERQSQRDIIEVNMWKDINDRLRQIIKRFKA